MMGSDVRALWEDQAGLCWYCKKHVPSRQGTVDHVVAKARGGTNDRTNKVMACAKCNTKTANKRTHRIKTLARLNVLRALAGAPPLTDFS